MRIKTITSWIETIAPVSFQESYDNAGLIIGDENREVNSVLVTLDVTPEVVQEARMKQIGLIISHHPLIFKGLKKINGKNQVERSVIEAIQNNIAIYAAHTNLDAVIGGVNSVFCSKLGLVNQQILRPAKGKLFKLVTFIPATHMQKVRDAVFNAGAGSIGNYDRCSFSTTGEGSFRGGENTHPFTGEKGKVHFEEEVRFETVFPAHLKSTIITALLNSHPYEEVAYDLYPLENEYYQAGMGMTGYLKKEWKEKAFLDFVKKTLNLKILKHTPWQNKLVKKVAVCGGTGSFLLPDAIRAGADVFITGDFKYHEFFEAGDEIMVVDIGHYESESLVMELFHDLIIKKFPTFAVQISEVNTNPVNYY